MLMGVPFGGAASPSARAASAVAMMNLGVLRGVV
jgi:hypothetical protein